MNPSLRSSYFNIIITKPTKMLRFCEFLWLSRGNTMLKIAYYKWQCYFLLSFIHDNLSRFKVSWPSKGHFSINSNLFERLPIYFPHQLNLSVLWNKTKKTSWGNYWLEFYCASFGTYFVNIKNLKDFLSLLWK